MIQKFEYNTSDITPDRNTKIYYVVYLKDFPRDREEYLKQLRIPVLYIKGKNTSVSRYYHNEEGPALTNSDGYMGYFINGIEYPTKKDWEIAIQKLKFSKKVETILEINGV